MRKSVLFLLRGAPIILRRLGQVRPRRAVLSSRYMVPTFFAWERKGIPTLYLKHYGLIFLVAVVFGLIHCAGWFSAFPSVAEQLIWKTSSFLIAAVPFTGLLVCIQLQYFQNGRILLRLKLLPIGAAMYLIARVVLLVIAIMALRDLPVGAYKVVEWTEFIPHI